MSRYTGVSERQIGMSAAAAVSPLANGGGLGSPTKEDTRWGYVREDDDDVSLFAVLRTDTVL